ncbi:DUF4225 domain-containing protein [Pantoea sp. Cy-640]|nr:DUF4225 domain-containing protein [Pantoea sp. Cy-640]
MRMSTSIIYGMVDEFNKNCTELLVTANRAAAFFISDGLIRTEYLYDIEQIVRAYKNDFAREERNPFRQGVILDDLKKEVDLTKREYQILRMKNYVTYILTDVFEEHGIIKYGKIALGIASGTAQTVAGGSLLLAGTRFHVRRFQGAGILLMAHGANNVFESASPLIYEQAHAGIIRKIYRKAAILSGFNKDSGDLAYSMVDFSLNVYAAIRSPILQQNNNRLVKKGLFEKPGTGALFRAVEKDYVMKWNTKKTPMKLFFAADTVRKGVMEFPLGGYKQDF